MYSALQVSCPQGRVNGQCLIRLGCLEQRQAVYIHVHVHVASSTSCLLPISAGQPTCKALQYARPNSPQHTVHTYKHATASSLIHKVHAHTYSQTSHDCAIYTVSFNGCAIATHTIVYTAHAYVHTSTCRCWITASIRLLYSQS